MGEIKIDMNYSAILFSKFGIAFWRSESDFLLEYLVC